jgi:hypothetical protein
VRRCRGALWFAWVFVASACDTIEVVDRPPDGGAAARAPASERFSFFVTSLAALQRHSGSSLGFGGDLRFGESGPGAGLRGADKLCAAIAEESLPGSASKPWRAFLSTSEVNARDRVGPGPWFDRNGRMVAASLADLLRRRPHGADAAIAGDLPNDEGVPNHDPTGAGAVDNHDVLTGTDEHGALYAASSTCADWTSAAPSGAPRMGHSWVRAPPPAGELASWLSAHDGTGCAPGVGLIETGPADPSHRHVGASGGYGAIYCFALLP